MKISKTGIVLIVLAMGLSSAVMAANGEMLTNGSFGSSTGWNYWSNDASTKAHANFSYSTVTPAGGSGPCLRLYEDAGKSASTIFGIWQKVTLMQGQTYTIGGYSKAINGTGVLAEMWIVDEDTTANADPINGHHAAASTYQEAMFAACVSARTKASASGWGTSGNFTVSNPTLWDTSVFSPLTNGQVAVHRANATYIASDSTGTNQNITGGTVDKWVILKVSTSSADIDVLFDSLSLYGPQVPLLPEPGSLLAMMTGIVGLVGLGIRRRK